MFSINSDRTEDVLRISAHALGVALEQVGCIAGVLLVYCWCIAGVLVVCC